MKATFRLEDHAAHPREPINVEVEMEEEHGMSWLLIRPEGYGDLVSDDGKGYPVALEMVDGKLRLVIWGDINNEDPTHVIDLEGAREDARRD